MCSFYRRRSYFINFCISVAMCCSMQSCSRRRHIAINTSPNQSTSFCNCIARPLTTSVTQSRLCTARLIKVYHYTCSVYCSPVLYTMYLGNWNLCCYVISVLRPRWIRWKSQKYAGDFTCREYGIHVCDFNYSLPISLVMKAL